MRMVDDDASHDDEDERLDEAHGCGEVGLHVFLEELGRRS